MAWKQVVNFNLNKMGTKSGYCLQNTRLAFGVPAKYASAKDAMSANRNAGTLHDMACIPTNCAVPIFTSAGTYGHVMVYDMGTYYSDGKKVKSVNQSEYKWGETLNGVRIVEKVADPKPAKKSNEEIADEVIAGKWGNGTDRRKRLTDAGYDYNAVQAIVDKKLKGGSSTGALKVGDKVTLTKWVDANGTRLAQTRPYYYISQIIGGSKAVLRADNPTNGPIYAAVPLGSLKRV